MAIGNAVIGAWEHDNSDTVYREIQDNDAVVRVVVRPMSHAATLEDKMDQVTSRLSGRILQDIGRWVLACSGSLKLRGFHIWYTKHSCSCSGLSVLYFLHCLANLSNYSKGTPCQGKAPQVR